MKHIKKIESSCASAINMGTYITLVGQILLYLAPLFSDKELFPPEEEGEGEATTSS